MTRIDGDEEKRFGHAGSDAVKWVIFFALVIGAATAILFTVFPEWDMAIAGYFFTERRGFSIAAASWAKHVRTAANWIPWLFAGPAFAALILKLMFPTGRMFMPARAAVLLAATMALGPGLLVNGILKEHWGRPRPVHVDSFGGSHAFKPWYRSDGTCPTNCSFVSGEGALGYWLVAPASLVPGPAGAVAMVAAVAFGTLAGGLRIAFGGHFFTDVVFSGVLVILLIAAARWLLYDRPRPPTDAGIEAGVGAAGTALRKAAAAIWTRLFARAPAPPG